MEKVAAILYIDDEEENLLGFKFSFSKLFSIFTANSYADALVALSAQESIGIVLVDYKLKEHDGISVVSLLKEKYPDLVYFIISAWADVEVVVKAMNLNIFYGFIQKPWSYNELLATLRNANIYYLSRLENKRLSQILIEKNEALQHSIEREREASRLKDIFLQNISHEIRTPLNSIIGFSFLVKSIATDDRTKVYSNFINQSGYQLLKIIQDILEVSAILSNQVNPKFTKFNLNQVAASVIADYAEEIERKQLLVSNKIQTNIQVTSDRSMVGKMLDAVLCNAIKFTNNGGVEISSTSRNGNVVVEVRDSGVGIEKGKMAQIFEPFRHSDESLARRFGGVGIGLFIAKSYATSLQGDIRVESEVGNGSSFFISFASG